MPKILSRSQVGQQVSYRADWPDSWQMIDTANYTNYFIFSPAGSAEVYTYNDGRSTAKVHLEADGDKQDLRKVFTGESSTDEAMIWSESLLGIQTE